MIVVNSLQKLNNKRGGGNMDRDLVVIAISGVFCILMLLNGLLKYQQWKNYYQSLHYFWVGLLILLIVTIFNSLTEKRWDFYFIVSFLSLEKVGKWLFRVIASYCYIYIAIGLEVLAIVKYNKYKNEKK